MWQALSSSGGRLVLGRSRNVGIQFTRAFATGLIATGVDILTVGLHYMLAKIVATGFISSSISRRASSCSFAARRSAGDRASLVPGSRDPR